MNTATHPSVEGLREQLAETDRKIESLTAPRDSLMEQLDTIREMEAPTNWVVGVYPGGTRYEEAIRLRRNLEAQRRPIIEEMHEFDNKLNPLRTRRNNLLASLAEAQREPITAESLQAAVDQAQSALAKVEAKRGPLERRMRETAKLLDKADAAQAEAETTSKTLEALRADKFISGARGRAAEIDDAIAAATLSQNYARSARAARPQIEQRQEIERDELATLEDEISGAKEHVANCVRKRDSWIANEALTSAISVLGEAFTAYCKVEPDRGRRLKEALRHEGLREFDERGSLERPQWLQRDALGR